MLGCQEILEFGEASANCASMLAMVELRTPRTNLEAPCGFLSANGNFLPMEPRRDHPPRGPQGVARLAHGRWIFELDSRGQLRSPDDVANVQRIGIFRGHPLAEFFLLEAVLGDRAILAGFTHVAIIMSSGVLNGFGVLRYGVNVIEIGKGEQLSATYVPDVPMSQLQLPQVSPDATHVVRLIVEVQ